jgi:hypothetical protein
MTKAPEAPDQKMVGEYRQEMRELELIEDELAYGAKRGSNKPTLETLRAALDNLKQADEAPTDEQP